MADPRWLQEAITHIGLKEVSGRADNPTILQFYKDCGHPEIEHDETAWCAAFVGACLKRAGKPTSAPADLNLMARSYLKYGVPLAKPVPGCIAIWPRGKPPSGHVGFVLEVDEAKGTVRTIEGNVSNRVKYGSHRISEALGYRFPPDEGIAPIDEPPTPKTPVTVKDVVATAASSKTVAMQLATPLVLVWGYASDGTQWLFDTLLSFTAVLPGLGNDIETSLGTAQQFSTWLNLPFAQISLAIVFGFCGFSIYRHVRDKLQSSQG
jgi:uncharacterized protein (TIGR02594 family)